MMASNYAYSNRANMMNPSAPKTLILCFDGMTNQYSENNTNVAKIYSMLSKECELTEQVIYYQPGIGQYYELGVVTPIFEWAAQIMTTRLRGTCINISSMDTSLLCRTGTRGTKSIFLDLAEVLTLRGVLRGCFIRSASWRKTTNSRLRMHTSCMNVQTPKGSPLPQASGAPSPVPSLSSSSACLAPSRVSA